MLRRSCGASGEESEQSLAQWRPRAPSASRSALLAGAMAASPLVSSALRHGFLLRCFLRVGNIAVINCVILVCHLCHHLERLFRPSVALNLLLLSLCVQLLQSPPDF